MNIDEWTGRSAERPNHWNERCYHRTANDDKPKQHAWRIDCVSTYTHFLCRELFIASVIFPSHCKMFVLRP